MMQIIYQNVLKNLIINYKMILNNDTNELINELHFDNKQSN
jgi:hypothetical protein